MKTWSLLCALLAAACTLPHERDHSARTTSDQTSLLGIERREDPVFQEMYSAMDGNTAGEA